MLLLASKYFDPYIKVIFLFTLHLKKAHSLNKKNNLDERSGINKGVFNDYTNDKDVKKKKKWKPEMKIIKEVWTGQEEDTKGREERRRKMLLTLDTTYCLVLLRAVHPPSSDQ